jgi:hypothetical protein
MMRRGPAWLGLVVCVGLGTLLHASVYRFPLRRGRMGEDTRGGTPESFCADEPLSGSGLWQGSGLEFTASSLVYGNSTEVIPSTVGARTKKGFRAG